MFPEGKLGNFKTVYESGHDRSLRINHLHPVERRTKTPTRWENSGTFPYVGTCPGHTGPPRRVPVKRSLDSSDGQHGVPSSKKDDETCVWS